MLQRRKLIRMLLPDISDTRKDHQVSEVEVTFLHIYSSHENNNSQKQFFAYCENTKNAVICFCFLFCLTHKTELIIKVFIHRVHIRDHSQSVVEVFFAARGSGTRFTLVGPTKVKARKSFLFTEKFLVLKVKNTCLICYHVHMKNFYNLQLLT